MLKNYTENTYHLYILEVKYTYIVYLIKIYTVTISVVFIVQNTADLILNALEIIGHLT